MQAFLSIVILLVILAVFVLAMWYTAGRLHAHFEFFTFKQWMLTVISVAVGSLALLLISSAFSNSFASLLNIISGYLLLFVIFSFILLGLLHIVLLIWKLPLMWSGAVVLAIALIVTVHSGVMGSSFLVKETEIKIKGLENELTIMQISDVHLGHHRGHDYLKKIVKTTNARTPDLILITGDLVEGKSGLLPGVLGWLADFYAPVYFVMGNHDAEADGERLLKLLEEHNIRVLHNEIVETQGIQLIGLDYMKADEDTFDMHPSDNTETAKSVLEGMTLKSEVPSVVMAHSPVGVKYADAAGIDLILSGHTHGGQVFPMSLLAKMMFPFNSGMHQEGNTKVFVSSGAGTYMVRARLGSRNEINLLRLVPER
ncbi:MAG: metallophosphoesterase [Oscillospiraceae bacterium]|nr:metallophosphoesterase [Oscillospiraceae bacterium]